MSWKMKPDSLIHLRVPAATKGRWIRASRAASMKLGDWIIQAVEAQMQAIKIVIPEDLQFADLRLARDTDHVSFDMAVVTRIELASGLPEGFFMAQAEDVLSGVLVEWYGRHVAAGGARDAVADDLISEVHAEDAAGQFHGHRPGRA